MIATKWLTDSAQPFRPDLQLSKEEGVKSNDAKVIADVDDERCDSRIDNRLMRKCGGSVGSYQHGREDRANSQKRRGLLSFNHCIWWSDFFSGKEKSNDNQPYCDHHDF